MNWMIIRMIQWFIVRLVTQDTFTDLSQITLYARLTGSSSNTPNNLGYYLVLNKGTRGFTSNTATKTNLESLNKIQTIKAIWYQQIKKQTKCSSFLYLNLRQFKICCLPVCYFYKKPLLNPPFTYNISCFYKSWI